MAITKALYLNWLTCPTLAWFDANLEQPELTEAQKFRMKQGIEVGERARRLFSGGVLVDTPDFTSACKQTQTQLKQASVIFEAAFAYDGFAARADVLVKEKAGWRLIEVKSSLHKDNSFDDDHINDLAYTAAILTNSGITISGIELMRISPQWRLGDRDEALLKRVSVEKLVRPKIKEIEDTFLLMHADVSSSVRPNAKMCRACSKCRYFEEHCMGKTLKHPITQIPRLSRKQIAELVSAGTVSIESLPVDYPLTPLQKRVVNAVRNKKPDLDAKALKSTLKKIIFPAFYLDFEAFMLAVPVWSGIAPHQAVVTQYSLHVCDRPGNIIEHHDYISEAHGDHRRNLTKHLLDKLGEEGSIVVYSSYEKTMLNGLASAFPEVKERIDACIARLYDLEGPFKESYCHPDFGGKTSIKKTLEVMIPEMSYSSLAIRSGDEAIAMYGRLVGGDGTNEALKVIRKNLLEYCRQDTLAMVKLHEALVSMVE